MSIPVLYFLKGKWSFAKPQWMVSSVMEGRGNPYSVRKNTLLQIAKICPKFLGGTNDIVTFGKFRGADLNACLLRGTKSATPVCKASLKGDKKYIYIF